MIPKITDPVIAEQVVVTDESKTNTVTGLNALTLPTPDKIKAIFKMIAFFIGIVALGATSFREISEETQKQILEYTVFLGLVMQKAEDFWGIKIN